MKLKKLFKKIDWPEYILIGGLVFVLLSLVLFYLIDLRNIFGLRDALFNLSSDYFYFTYRPFFFQNWGRNSGIVEILQWLCLGGSAVLAAFFAGRFSVDKTKKLFKFWIILAIALFFMLLEDAGDIRHTFMSYVQVAFDEPDQGWGGTMFEFFYFALLGGLPLYALIRYGWTGLREYSKTRFYIVIGFIFYFLASSFSFLGTAFSGILDKDLYTLWGQKLYDLSLRLGDPELAIKWEAWEQVNLLFPIGLFLMDSFVEELIELIGASALLAASVSFLIYLKKKKPS